MSFNEPVQFLYNDPEMIAYELTHNTLEIKITSGYDGSSYIAYQDRVEVEEVVEEIEVEIELTEEEMAALEKEKKLEAFNDKISLMSIATW